MIWEYIYTQEQIQIVVLHKFLSKRNTILEDNCGMNTNEKVDECLADKVNN